MQYAVSFSPIVFTHFPHFSQSSTLDPQIRHYSTPRRGIAPLVCVATPVFLPSFTPHSEPSGSQEGLTTELFSPAPVHRSHPFFHTLSRSQLIKFAICRTCTTYRLSGWPDISFHQAFGTSKLSLSPPQYPCGVREENRTPTIRLEV